MNWTNEKPTADGWYWHNENGTKEIVRVHGEEVELTGSSSDYFLEDMGGEWAGPIPEPIPMPEPANETPMQRAERRMKAAIDALWHDPMSDAVKRELVAASDALQEERRRAAKTQ